MPQSVDLAAVKCLMDQDAQIVDVLPPEEYADEHLPRAINVPLKRLTATSTEQLNRRKPVVVYCHDGL